MENLELNVKKVFYVSIAIFLVSNMFLLSVDFDLASEFLIIALLPSIIFLIIANKNMFLSVIKGNTSYLKFWLLYLIILVVSEIINGQVRDSIALIAIPVFIIGLDLNIKELMSSLFLGLLPMTIIILGFQGYKFTSNGAGLYLSAMVIILIILYYINKVTKRTTLVIFFSLAILIRGILLINSRTSILIAFIAVMLFLFDLIHSNFDHIKRIFNKKIRRFIIPFALLVGVVVLYNFYELIFTLKWQGSDISSGRFIIWRRVIENATLLGHNYDWFITSAMFGSSPGPHNVLIAVLAFSGIIGLFCFLWFLVVYLKEHVINYSTNKESTNFIYLLLIIASLTKGITESMILSSTYEIYNILFLTPLVYHSVEKRDIAIEVVIPKENKITNSLNYAWFLFIIMFAIYATVFEYDIMGAIQRIMLWF